MKQSLICRNRVECSHERINALLFLDDREYSILKVTHLIKLYRIIPIPPLEILYTIHCRADKNESLFSPPCLILFEPSGD